MTDSCWDGERSNLLARQTRSQGERFEEPGRRPSWRWIFRNWRICASNDWEMVGWGSSRSKGASRYHSLASLHPIVSTNALLVRTQNGRTPSIWRKYLSSPVGSPPKRRGELRDGRLTLRSLPLTVQAPRLETPQLWYRQGRTPQASERSRIKCSIHVM